MEASVVAIAVFICAFGGALLGIWSRAVLPGHYFDAESRDTVKVGIGLISTMTALVLGLVTASAKSSFDDVNKAVKQTATQLLALDRTLARYGTETSEIRKGLQGTIGGRIHMIWPQDSSKGVDMDPEHVSGRVEGLAHAIRHLTPKDDSQRALQARALGLAEALLEARWLMIAGTGTSVPLPFLVVLLLWLTIIFVSFGLFAPRNAMVLTVLFVCALSVGSAVFLILEMDGPFDGLLKVSADPLRIAYSHLNK